MTFTMNTTQDRIDDLVRQQLSIQLLSCILQNQIHGTPSGKLGLAQMDLCIHAASQVECLKNQINHLVDVRGF
jgi:acetolactate synthase regulatory subunit